MTELEKGQMITNLNKLAVRKQKELEIIVQMIREEFEVEMIILFGSYARGDWVEELGPDNFYYKYQSDFDILVIADTKVAKKRPKWARLESNIRRSSAVKTPVTIIHHSIGFFNTKLLEGHYFFSDIKKEGILLYDSEKHELNEPKQLTPAERKKKAQKYFNHWFESAESFFKNYKFSINEGDFKVASFLLHQATERYYSTLLLVLTDYRPKTHDIEKLSNLASGREPQILEVFPQGTKEDKNRFELLRKAYVDARYEISFTISKEDLIWLESRVVLLKNLTRSICAKRMESFDK